MKKFSIGYYILLIIFTIYVLLNTFLISNVYETVNSTDEEKELATNVNVTNTIYEDDNIQINLQTYRYNDTNIYVCDITLDDSSYLKIPVTHEEIDRAAKLAGSPESDHLVETYVETVKNYIDAKIKEGE